MRVREPEERNHDAALVSAMMQTGGYRVLKEFLANQVDLLEKAILAGRLSHEDYLARSGELKGVKSVVMEIENHASRHAQEARKSA